MITTRTRRALGAGASLAVAAAGLSALAPAAVAASGPQPFTCTVSILGEKTFTVDADTNLPAKVEQGKKVNFTFTADVSVPDDVRSTALFFFGNQVKGDAAITATAGGASSAVSASIPLTEVPTATGPLVVQATGQGSWTPTTVGKQKVVVSGFTANLTFIKDGTAGAPVSVPCTAPTPVEVDEVEVTKATKPPVPPKPVVSPSKTTAKVVYAKRAKRATVTATVKVGKKAATGKVTVKLKRGKKTVRTVNVKLNKRGVAKATFKRISKKGKYTATVTYKGNKTTKKSSKRVSFRVR